MSSFVRLTCAVALIVGGLSARAHEGEGPVYQRSRYGGQPTYGYYSGNGVGHYDPGYSRYGGGNYRQALSGNWFVRPYPYHFDYYKWRYSTPPPAPGSQDCPCADTPAPE